MAREGYGAGGIWRGRDMAREGYGGGNYGASRAPPCAHSARMPAHTQAARARVPSHHPHPRSLGYLVTTPTLRQAGLWLRNIQLGMFALPLAAAGMLTQDPEQLRDYGMLQVNPHPHLTLTPTPTVTLTLTLTLTPTPTVTLTLTLTLTLT